jgi:hypothetical protein
MHNDGDTLEDYYKRGDDDQRATLQQQKLLLVKVAITYVRKGSIGGGTMFGSIFGKSQNSLLI